jgi:uncharacterized HAD superfamily protein
VSDAKACAMRSRQRSKNPATSVVGGSISLESIMGKYIAIPTIGEILREEFMEHMNISAYKLAKEIKCDNLQQIFLLEIW